MLGWQKAPACVLKCQRKEFRMLGENPGRERHRGASPQILETYNNKVENRKWYKKGRRLVTVEAGDGYTAFIILCVDFVNVWNLHYKKLNKKPV